VNTPYIVQYRGAGPFTHLVWRAAYARGPLREGGAQWEDAYAMALEAAGRARRNLEAIVGHLEQLGYRFSGFPSDDEGTPGPVWLRPDADTPAQLARLAELAGPVPLSLRAWYEVVGGITLVGAFPGTDAGGQSLSPLSDALHVDPLPALIAQLQEAGDPGWDDHAGGSGNGDGGASGGGEAGRALDVSPDIYHKAGQSGGAPYTVRLPDDRVDTPLHNVRILLPLPDEALVATIEVETGETFMEYIRRSMHWAGFPGFAFVPDPCAEMVRPLFGAMLPI
jgi:hypothetical protein